MYTVPEKKDVDLLMERFCQDALSELKSYDRKLRNKLIRGEETATTHGFYTNFPKGISIYGVTEPIIKWLIFTGLCDKYCMNTEYWTSDGKFLDLALSVNPDSDFLDIAIEMKWAGFRKKDGRIYENYRLSMIDDAVKLHKMNIPYKYLMQFAILSEDEYKRIDFKATYDDFHIFDKRQFRNGVLSPAPIFKNSFPTWDKDSNPRRFAMFVWEVSRQ